MSKDDRYLVVAQRVLDTLAGEYEKDAVSGLGAVLVQMCKELGMNRKTFIAVCRDVWDNDPKVKAAIEARRAIDGMEATVLKEAMLKKAKNDPLGKS